MEKNLELQEMTVEEMKTFIKLGKKKEEMFQALQKGNGMKVFRLLKIIRFTQMTRILRSETVSSI